MLIHQRRSDWAYQLQKPYPFIILCHCLAYGTIKSPALFKQWLFEITTSVGNKRNAQVPEPEPHDSPVLCALTGPNRLSERANHPNYCPRRCVEIHSTASPPRGEGSQVTITSGVAVDTQGNFLMQENVKFKVKRAIPPGQCNVSEGEKQSSQSALL